MKNDKIPESFKLIRDQIVKYKSPLGIPLRTIASWCKNPNTSFEKILYTGGLYSTMGVVMKYDYLFPFISKTPSNEGRIKLIKNFMFLANYFMPISFLRHGKFEKIPTKALEILHYLGYEDVGCLPEEPYNGALLHDLGFKKDLVEYGEYLRDFFKEKGVKEIILIDPHTYQLFKEIYPRDVKGFDFKVAHFLDIVVKHLDEMELKYPGTSNTEKVPITYHDPCILAKRLENKLIEQPRFILNKIDGTELREAFNSGETATCCGGPLEFIFVDVSKRVAKNRFEQFVETGAKQVVTACPICYISFHRVKGKTKLVDIIDLIHSSIKR